VAVAELHGAMKVYGAGDLAVTALHETDLAVHEGEVTLLVGPSGSGKSTLLSLLGGVLRPTRGQVVLLGRDLGTLDDDGLADLRRDRIGFIFQQFNLLSALNAEQNVEVPLMLQGVSRGERRERARAALDRVGILRRARNHPAQLSGGEQQRVAIARAVVADPPLLLCDEPTAALDHATGGEVLSLLSGLAHHDGRAVLVVTHDPRVFGAGDRILEIEDGRLRAERRRGALHRIGEGEGPAGPP
jgi:putative ABC transport system ATP-binding protein